MVFVLSCLSVVRCLLIVRCLFCGAASGKFVFLVPFSLLGELENETVIVVMEFSVLHYFIFLEISVYSPLDLFCYSARYIQLVVNVLLCSLLLINYKQMVPFLAGLLRYYTIGWPTLDSPGQPLLIYCMDHSSLLSDGRALIAGKHSTLTHTFINTHKPHYNQTIFSRCFTISHSLTIFFFLVVDFIY